MKVISFTNELKLMSQISRVVEYKPALVTSRDPLTGYLLHSYVNEVSLDTFFLSCNISNVMNLNLL